MSLKQWYFERKQSGFGGSAGPDHQIVARRINLARFLGRDLKLKAGGRLDAFIEPGEYLALKLPFIRLSQITSARDY
jgi:hypothetical protein